MPTLYMMIGVPGSGKSTIAKSLGFKVVSTDDLRELINGDASSQMNGDLVFRTAKNILKEELLNGKSVIFDAMNVKPRYRKDILLSVPDCRKVAIVVDTPLEICKERNLNRLRYVPEEIIDRNYEIFKDNPPREEEGFDEIIYR